MTSSISAHFISLRSRRDYASSQGRAPLYEQILGVCSYIFYLLFPAFLFFLSSCTEKETSFIGQDNTSILSQVEVKADAAVSSLDIFIYDKSGVLDSWQRTVLRENIKTEIASRAGERDVVMVANTPEGFFSWDDIKHLDALREKFYSLTDENPDRPVMVGSMSFTAGKSFIISLQPLMAKISLESICCDFSGKPYEGESISNARAYIINVCGRTRLYPEDAENPSVWLNSGAMDASDSLAMGRPSMLVQEFNAAIGEKAVHPGMSFYSYPNLVESDAIGTPYTRLVIEGELAGEKYYWPVNIHPVDRNLWYKVNLTITRLGSNSPDVPVDAGSLDVECRPEPWKDKGGSIVRFRFAPMGLADGQVENQISDLNVFAFNSRGALEARKWLSRRSLASGTDGSANCVLSLLKDEEYTVYACANLGYELKGITDAAMLENTEWWLAYPDEFSKGMPMAGKAEHFCIESMPGSTEGGRETVDLNLRRLMSKINLNVDLSGLSGNVRMNFVSARVGNCSRKTRIFSTFMVSSEDEVFTNGYSASFDSENKLSLYAMENLQASSDRYSSYIEIMVEYWSNLWYTEPGQYLIYRFRPGEENGKTELERGAEYSYTIRPEGDGLAGTDSWRTDKSCIKPYSSGYLVLHPADYIRGDIGDKIHLWVDLYPELTPFDIGLEDLEDEKSKGLIDYVIDEDGHGVMIELKKPGVALICGEAGEPVNDDFMALIEINLPRDG